MDYSDVLNKYKVNKSALIKYGFIKENNLFLYKKDIDNDLYVLISIDKSFLVKVYDKNTNEEYLPFNIKNKEFTSNIDSKVKMIVNNVLNNCFNKVNLKDDIIAFEREKRNVLIEKPWKKNPSYVTFKTLKNKKWYAVIMDVPCKVLGINKDYKVDIINLKNDPKVIEKLIDNKTYFKAYHMNKENWITILLDNKIDIKLLELLIEDSYNLVRKKG